MSSESYKKVRHYSHLYWRIQEILNFVLTSDRKIIKPGKFNKCRISSRATQCRVLVKVVLLRAGGSLPVLYLYSWDIARGGWQLHCKNLYTARQLCTIGREQRKEEQFAGRTLLFGLLRRLFDQRVELRRRRVMGEGRLWQLFTLNLKLRGQEQEERERFSIFKKLLIFLSKI